MISQEKCTKIPGERYYQWSDQARMELNYLCIVIRPIGKPVFK